MTGIVRGVVATNLHSRPITSARRADDGSSAVSLPELPLLAVLPGTGGLTRVTDKRKVRRDHADVFCTTEEGVKGKRAVDWRLVDEVVAAPKLDEIVSAEQRNLRPSLTDRLALSALL